MDNINYCYGCLSTETGLLLPSKSLVETYLMLVTPSEMKSLQKIPENDIFLCVSCCQSISKVQKFRISCQNASQFLLERNFLGKNNEMRKNIDNHLQKLVEESIKTENSCDEMEGFPMETDFGDDDVKNELKNEFPSPILIQKRTNSQEELCILCKTSFPTYSKDQTTFSMHIDSAHATKGKSNFYCKHCEASYKAAGNLRKHFRECHNITNKLIECQFCSKTFYRKPLYFAHLKKDHASLASRYECDICKKVIQGQKDALRRHVITHIVQSTCKHCNATFSDKMDFKKHRRGCGDRYMCHFCSIVLLTKKALEIHIQCKHLPAPPCDICGMEFTRRMDLVHHKKIEHSEKSKTCEQCGKSFFTQHGLNSHIKYTHEKSENEYTKRRYWCELCQRYESHTTKNAHELKVKYGKRFKCELCDLRFYSKQRLKRHQHVHTKTRPFNCKLCDTGYYNIPYLKGHYERAHGSEYLGAIRK